MFTLYRCKDPKTMHDVLRSNTETTTTRVFYATLPAGCIRAVQDKLAHSVGALAICEPRNDKMASCSPMACERKCTVQRRNHAQKT